MRQAIVEDLHFRSPVDKGDYMPVVTLVLSDPPTDSWRPVASNLNVISGSVIALVVGSQFDAESLREVIPETFEVSEISSGFFRSTIRFHSQPALQVTVDS